MANIDTLNEKFKKIVALRSWDLINKKLPKEHLPVLLDRDGAAKFIKILPDVFKPDNIISDKEAHECWEAIGNFYKNQERFYEAISIYAALYNQFLVAQEKQEVVVIKECLLYGLVTVTHHSIVLFWQNVI